MVSVVQQNGFIFKACIVFTHALDEALIRRYDCILTLKNGCAAEAGTFSALMEKKGYFYSLYTVSQ